MAGNVVPENRQRGGLTGEAGGSSKGILLLLLAIAVCFGYFYFFTDVLRSKEETPSQPEVYTSEVKKPLPERPGTLAKVESAPTPSSPSPEEKTAAASGEAPGKPGTPPAASMPQVSPSALPSAGKKASVPPLSPALKAASGPAGETKTAVATAAPSAGTRETKTAAGGVKSLEKPKAVAAKSKPGPEKTATTAAVKELAKTPEKSHSVPTADKKMAPSKAKSTPAAEAQKTAGRFTLQIGTYVMKATMLSDKAKLDKAGFETRVTSGPKKSEPMNRLLVAEFTSYSSARSELVRLGKSTKGAFMLREKGKFAVYAGSYFSRERAVEEQTRLRGKGIAPIIKSSEAPVATYTLTSGSFSTREEAERHAVGLRKLGFKPIPLQLAKQ